MRTARIKGGQESKPGRFPYLGTVMTCRADNESGATMTRVGGRITYPGAVMTLVGSRLTDLDRSRS
jgi:hypothetical protein